MRRRIIRRKFRSYRTALKGLQGRKSACARYKVKNVFKVVCKDASGNITSIKLQQGNNCCPANARKGKFGRCYRAYVDPTTKETRHRVVGKVACKHGKKGKKR